MRVQINPGAQMSRLIRLARTKWPLRAPVISTSQSFDLEDHVDEYLDKIQPKIVQLQNEERTQNERQSLDELLEVFKIISSSP